MSDVIEELRRQLREKDEAMREKDETIGDLRRQLVERERVLLILKVRSRIEELEKKFLPVAGLHDTRRNKWGKIMRSPNNFYTSNVELMRFRASVTTDIALFINTICLLYGDFSDIAAHKINFPIPYDDDSINQMLTDVGVTPDIAKVEVIHTILTPITL